MRMLPDDQYHQWPCFVSRIVFAYNTAPHQSLGGASPFELYCGMPARDTFSRILTDQTTLLPQLATDDGDTENARLFAAAVKTSMAAFIQLAKNHDEFIKAKSAALLNQKGFPRAFAVNDKVKIRFPPTKAELDATGRRFNHLCLLGGVPAKSSSVSFPPPTGFFNWTIFASMSDPCRTCSLGMPLRHAVLGTPSLTLPRALRFLSVNSLRFEMNLLAGFIWLK